ncbi:hypothetical protein NUU61_002091 [Penicillium alfredii]|uniref:WW domain-containing protein n=1 Tax=Penicillium alfredii TaxID=1506179 RepID=A0A9W9KFN2_9EURO|nr:uncharacterized protein NUU61_002091 [Penicillium alfredii]KAJ5104744.1 hypothetical protein NUU61_002091 [Penicillium alfredii]
MPAQSNTSAPTPEEGAGSPSAPGSPQPRTDEKRETKPLHKDNPEDQDTSEQQKKEEEEEDDGEETGSQPSEDKEDDQASAPPLPDEVPPPLPDEAPPGPAEDDGWEPVWDNNAQAYYFYNRFTGVSQWDNPRVPNAAGSDAPTPAPKPKAPAVGGYNPAIHGDYDPNAPYAQQYEEQAQPDSSATGLDPSAAYAATGSFNRFTGRWQATDINPDNYSDQNKAHRQMNAFFDVDSAANTHDGRSLRAERSAKKLSKKELKMFKEKRREKKEEKRRAWLRD